MAVVADYSAGKPGAWALKTAGFIGAVRYIGFSDPNDARTPKCTNRAELDDFTANDMGMALVFESRSDDWRGGYSAGYNNYLIARRHANQIGFPASRPIYMAVDSEVIGASNHAQMADYIRGARDAAGGPHLVGVYGQYSVCQYLADFGGICDWYWQCRAWSGLPEPRYFSGRHLFQHVGTVYAGPIPCDVNDVNRDDWGQHLEDDMSVLTEEVELWGQPGKNTTLAKELAWLPENFRAIRQQISDLNAKVNALEEKVSRPAPVALTPEDLAAIIGALKTELPAAVVAEFKKEGN